MNMTLKNTCDAPLSNDNISASKLSHTPDIKRPQPICDGTVSNTPNNCKQPNQCNGNNLITPSLFRNAIKSQRGIKLIHFNARRLKGVNS